MVRAVHQLLRRRRPRLDRRWSVHLGTATGAGHLAGGRSSQDAVLQRGRPGAGVVAVAVADGHGGAAHHRSAQGAGFAVQAGCAVTLGLVRRLSSCRSDAEVLAVAAAVLPKEITGAWRRAVARHRAAHPYSDAGRSGPGIARDAGDTPYGSTLLVCLAARRWLVLAQIGDGDVLLALRGGQALSPVPADDRLDGLHTTSLCRPSAEQDFRLAVCDLADTPVRAVLLATDGYANAQTEQAWEPAVAADLARMADERSPAWFDGQVPRWAERCASSQGSGDDTTLGLLLADRLEPQGH